ncbi:MAG: phage holin family protein [Chloroflexota bacterium]|nr:phage holin family protein [Chloroflexota bacterium]
MATEFGVGFYVAGFWPAFWGALVISVVNLISSLLIEGG